MNPSADVSGTFHLFANGGRTQPSFSGYRPVHWLYDNYQTSGEHRYPKTGSAAVGETVDVEVWFLTPHVYPASVWVGRDIGVYEGSKQVGVLHITAVHNPILLGRSDSYTPLWHEPPGLSQDGA